LGFYFFLFLFRFYVFSAFEACFCLGFLFFVLFFEHQLQADLVFTLGAELGFLFFVLFFEHQLQADL